MPVASLKVGLTLATSPSVTDAPDEATIGAPGAASLEAVMDPAPGDWLYYVLADCSGNHHFASDYDDFLNAKSRYQALDC